MCVRCSCVMSPGHAVVEPVEGSPVLRGSRMFGGGTFRFTAENSFHDPGGTCVSWASRGPRPAGALRNPGESLRTAPPTCRRCTAPCAGSAAEMPPHVPLPCEGAAAVGAGASAVGSGRSLSTTGLADLQLSLGAPVGVTAGAGVAARSKPGKVGPFSAVAWAVVGVGAGPSVWQVVAVLNAASTVVPDALRVAVSAIPQRQLVPPAAVVAD